MVYVIGCKGYIGANLMKQYPAAVGIARGDEWPAFERDDWVINAASYFWHDMPFDRGRAESTNLGIPKRLLEYDCNIIQLTSTAAEERGGELCWQYKKAGDDLLLGKAHILILPTIYGGIQQHEHMFMTALLDEFRGPFVLETPDAMRDFVHIVNVKACIYSIIAGRFRAIRKPHRLTSGSEISMLTMSRIVRDLKHEFGG